jgi:hypothetical protein
VLPQLFAIANDFLTHGFDEWAMVADEHDKQAIASPLARKRVPLTVDAGQIEMRRAPAKIANGSG